MATRAVRRYGMAGLVDGNRVALTLDVLDVLAGSEGLQVLGLDGVGPRDAIASVADGADESLVDEVLDRRTCRVRRDDGELLDLVGRELVGHLFEVALV